MAQTSLVPLLTRRRSDGSACSCRVRWMFLLFPLPLSRTHIRPLPGVACLLPCPTLSTCHYSETPPIRLITARAKFSIGRPHVQLPPRLATDRRLRYGAHTDMYTKPPPLGISLTYQGYKTPTTGGGFPGFTLTSPRERSKLRVSSTPRLSRSHTTVAKKLYDGHSPFPFPPLAQCTPRSSQATSSSSRPAVPRASNRSPPNTPTWRDR